MSALPAVRLWEADDYLAWEHKQPSKHELIDNCVVAMTGASWAHSIIAVNIAALLNFQLREKPCEVYVADMRVQVKRESSYTYPDVVVGCEPRFRDDVKPDTLENPTLIFEILSPSTAVIDRNRKFEQCLQLESLAAYFLAAQDKPRIESYTRQPDGWLYQNRAGLEAALMVEALDSALPLKDIYDKVQFEPPR